MSHRIQIDFDPSEAESVRADIIARGFSLSRLESVRRDTHVARHPNADEEYYEERYAHRDGNIVRFFPCSKVASGPAKNELVGILIEYMPGQGVPASATEE